MYTPVFHKKRSNSTESFSTLPPHIPNKSAKPSTTEPHSQQTSVPIYPYILHTQPKGNENFLIDVSRLSRCIAIINDGAACARACHCAPVTLIRRNWHRRARAAPAMIGISRRKPPRISRGFRGVASRDDLLKSK